MHILEEFDDYLNLNVRQDDVLNDNSKEEVKMENTTFQLSEENTIKK